jgi:adenylate cyclase
VVVLKNTLMRIINEPAAPDVGTATTGIVLLVDDHKLNRTVVRKPLEAHGFTVLEAESGEQALDLCSKENAVDVIVLDIMMAGMDGFEVCSRLKGDPTTAEIPVLMVTSLSGKEERKKGIEAGARDFLTKPVDLDELFLRVRNAIQSKHTVDALKRERETAESLLLHVFPVSIANRMRNGETGIAEVYRAASILLAELVGFTDLADFIPPEEMVLLLNEIYSEFDNLVEKHGVEKVRIFGSRYLAVSGVPDARPDHAAALSGLALDMRDAMEKFNREYNLSVRLRLCISSGPIVAGVIGQKGFTYDVWGTTVNSVWNLNSLISGPEILISPATWEELRSEQAFDCERIKVFNTSAYVLHARANPGTSDARIKTLVED